MMYQKSVAQSNFSQAASAAASKANQFSESAPVAPRKYELLKLGLFGETDASLQFGQPTNLSKTKSTYF